MRLSETSAYLFGQVKHPLAIIRQTSEHLRPHFSCRLLYERLKMSSILYVICITSRNVTWMTEIFSLSSKTETSYLLLYKSTFGDSGIDIKNVRSIFARQNYF